MPRLACAGGSNVARHRAHYVGLQTCAAAALVAGGGKACFWGCLGLGDCDRACEYDAIEMDRQPSKTVRWCNRVLPSGLMLFGTFGGRKRPMINANRAEGVPKPSRAAHSGALAANAPTIAVCGTGLDIVYPATNRRLADSIVTRGALLSEFAPGIGPRPAHFPRRNRLISGLALGVVVPDLAGLSQ